MKGSENLIFKSTEMCSLIENVLLNLLIVPLNYLSTHYLPNCLYAYIDVGGVLSSFYTFNTQLWGTRRIKMCSLKIFWGEPCTNVIEIRLCTLMFQLVCGSDHNIAGLSSSFLLCRWTEGGQHVQLWKVQEVWSLLLFLM